MKKLFLAIGLLMLLLASCQKVSKKNMKDLYTSEQKVPFDSLKGEFLDVGENGLIYRGVPFWSWNGDLEPQEVRRQIREFKKAGLAGFFMHGRKGLITPYLSERWMECVSASVDEAQNVGMHAWLYDENGFPSGGADGRVAAAGEEYQRKTLGLSEETSETFTWGPKTVAVFTVERHGKSLDNLHRLTSSESVKLLPAGTIILHFSYEAKGYVDVLSKKAIRKFIDLTYEDYYKTFGDKFGSEIPGIFTDEPSYGLMPWSFDLPEQFAKKNGYDIYKILPAIFYRVDGYQKARNDYWSTVLNMYVEAYMEQLGSWSREHGIVLTGHLAWTETLMGQMTFNADPMASYEFMDMPGTNHLGVRLMNAMREKQVASVARQMGGRRFLCEIAGGMGWGVTFEELKWVTEWQLALGVNFLTPHMLHYTLHGDAKRDIPPSYSYQQPWWDQFKMLNDYFARLIFMLTQGRRVTNILMIHPITSAWTLFDGSHITGGVDTHGGPGFVAYNDRQAEISNAMLAIHRDFDFGDERIISRHGRVKGDQFIIGDAAYRFVFLPELLSIRRTTFEFLKKFISNGGTVVSIGNPPQMINGVLSEELTETLSHVHRIMLPSWPPNFQKAGRYDQPKTWIGTRIALKKGLDGISSPALEISDEKGQEVEHIYSHLRDLGKGRQLLFLVNISREKGVNTTVRIKTTGNNVTRWDAATGKSHPIPSRRQGEYTTMDLSFEPMQSYLLVLDSAAPNRNISLSSGGDTLNAIELSAPWKVQTSDPNALTIDWCRWALGTDKFSLSQPTLKVKRHLTKYLGKNPKEQPDLTLEYSFQVVPPVFNPDSMMLIMETPRLFSITVNGKHVNSEDVGWWRDIAFRKIPIGSYVQKGKNTITLKGKLTPRTEIESVYITGDFKVKSLSRFWTGDRETVLTKGPFAICKRQDIIQQGNLAGSTDLTSQGYWFYAGNTSFSQSLDIPENWFDKEEKKQIWLELDPPDAILVRAIVNGKDAGIKAWRPFSFNVTKLLNPGRNQITLELYGSLRNLLGPHHHWSGEVLYTGYAFNFKKSVSEEGPEVPENTWVDRYCFIRFGLSGIPKLSCVTVK